MTTVHVRACKAESIGPITPPDAVITIDISLSGKIGNYENRSAARHLYRDEARQIAEALRASLPGGTMDELLIALLEAQASILMVPHGRSDS